MSKIRSPGDCPSGKGSDRAEISDRLASGSDLQNGSSPKSNQASPWATAPLLQPDDPVPITAFIGKKLALVLACPGMRFPPPADEWFAALRKRTPTMLCLLCDSATRETDTLVVIGQSQAGFTTFASTWFCERCSEMDDEALLDCAEARFRDELQGELQCQIRCR